MSEIFDATGAFAKQFIPVEGGYVYYPSAKSGGKFISESEYRRLAERWNWVSGHKASWILAAAVCFVVLIWTLISSSIDLPEWSSTIVPIICVFAVVGWVVWEGFAPRRFVKNRPDIAPPRPTSETRKHARALLNWRFILFALIMSGIVFLGSILSAPTTIVSWAWLIGSGTIFVGYIWIAIQKARDR